MRKVHYVNNKKFQEEMLIYHQKLLLSKENNEPAPIPSNYIGECILHIAKNYSNKPKFFGYSNLWKEEMIADGIEDCIKNGLKNYDPTRFSNPFAYFTEVIHWAFVRRIKREKREQYKKMKNKQNNDLVLSLASNKYVKADDDVTDHLIKDFETKLEEEKTKRNSKKGIDLFCE